MSDESQIQTFSIRCSREDLMTALQGADSVVPSNSTKPICTNFLIVGYEGVCEIMATDMQVHLRSLLRRVEVPVAGQVIVPARQLVSVIRESRSPSVRLACVSDPATQLRVELSDGEYLLPVLAGESFPAVSPFPAETMAVRLPGDRVARMIQNTVFAVDKERSSAVLSGLYVAVSEGELVMAATDGKVLAEAVYRAESLSQAPGMSVILPLATVQHLSRILAAGRAESVELVVGEKLVFLRVVIGSGEEGGAGNIQVELTSRVTEGTYPSYRNALPANPVATAEFRTEDLTFAVRRAGLLNSSSARGIVMELNEIGAVLSNMVHAAGSARIPVACRYQGAPAKYGFNANYLSEILKVVSGERLTIDFNGKGRGMIMREHDCTFLIMPITIPS